MTLVDRVRAAVSSAVETLAKAGLVSPEVLDGVSWAVERPKRPEHGDLATNVAMATAKKSGKPPRVVAEALVRALAGSDLVASAEVAGPGFVNLRLHPSALQSQVTQVIEAGRGWGRTFAATGPRVNVEFVSANPTGPVTVASGRNAILGDSVARLLEAVGARVTREYYVNDRGNQVLKLAESVLAASRGHAAPEDGYKGAYVAELAAWLGATAPELLLDSEPEALGRACVTWMLRGLPGSRSLPGIRPSLADLRVWFDVWFSEESLTRWGAVPAVMRQLETRGHLVRKEGALFFVAPEGALEDKDRVVQKSDGSWAYFASDIAYFADKISRGYDLLINVLGADHVGYVTRVRNALTALDLPEKRFEALLYQLVFITKNGVAVKSSKRAGDVVTIDEVMDEVDEATGRKGSGADALRFFFLSRSAGSNVEFDLELAKKRSLDNPVFYVQYGYARLCSIQRRARELGQLVPGQGVERAANAGPGDQAKLLHPDELSLCLRLAEFPELVREAASLREPHRVVFYLQDLAREFQSYFTRLKGENDPILPPESVRATEGWQASWDFGKTRARLAWIEAIRITYAQALELIGVTALERMDKPPDETDE
jgi:arginyl-tRNA synthetase